MVRSIIKASMQARVLVVALAAILVFLGISQLREAPMEIYPEFLPVHVEVQTEAFGLAANEVEQLLTVALEQDLLNGIAFLDEIWSQSMVGLSRVLCIFEPGTDPLHARQVVAEPMTQAHALPNVSTPPVMLQPYSSTNRVLNVGLTSASPEMSLIDMSVLARWTIKPYLMGVEGVANVSIWGQRKRQMQVQLDPSILKDKDVKLLDVIETTGEALWVSPLSFLESSTPGTGGFFDTPNQRLGVRHVFPISEPEQLERIPVANHENLLLGDVASVVENHPTLIGDAIIDNDPGLLLVVEKFPWANTVEVTEKVEQALVELKPGLSGINFNADIFRPADFVKDSNSNISSAVLIGLALLVASLFLLFYNWRTALISLISILVSLLVGAYVFHLTGMSFNMMVLAGLVLSMGIIIDDAVTSVENVKRNLLQHSQGNGNAMAKGNIIVAAISDMKNSILFATFIILLTVAPLYFYGDMAGKFFVPFTTSFVLAILASLVVSLTITPALSTFILSDAPLSESDGPLTGMLRGILGNGVAKPAMAYACFGLLALVSLVLYPMLEKDNSPPDLQTRDLVVEINADEGVSLSGMNKMAKKVMQELETVDGVSNVVTQIGRAVMSDKIENINSGEIWVNIDKNADYTATVDKINSLMEGHPELSPTVQTYLKQCISRNLRLTNHPYSVRVYGENQEILGKKAADVKEAISSVSGVSNAQVDYPATEPIIEVEVDIDAAREHEIKPGDIRRAAAVYLGGVEVGSLFEGQKVFEVVVWGIPDVRNNLEDVGDLWIDKPDGSHVRLGDVAKVNIVESPRVINREAVSRYMDVSFDYTGNDTEALAANIENGLASVDFPLEYHAELKGSFQDKVANSSNRLSLIIASIIGILLLFQAAFWNWRFAFITMASLLTALSGGLIAAFLSGGDLTMGELIGLVAIIGIASHQGIALIKHFKQLEMQHGMNFGANLVQRGIRDRFAPILISTLLTLVVFLPFVLLGNVAGLEIIRPMASVIIGGLITTLICTLYVMPGFYLQFGQTSEETKTEEKAMMELDQENIAVTESI